MRALRSAPVVFRPHLALRMVLTAALLLWMGVAAVVLGLHRGVAAHTVLGALGFCGLFSVLWAHYLPLEIRVDDHAVTYRGFLGLRRLAWTEIRAVEVVPVPMMVNYGVRTDRAVIAFTSVIAGHRDLLALIVERARLVQGTP